MFERLAQIEKTYEELTEQISSPEIMYRCLIATEVPNRSDVSAKLDVVCTFHPREIVDEIIRVGAPSKRICEVQG